MLVGAQHAMGHTNPASTAHDYVAPLDDPIRQFVIDAFASCYFAQGQDAAARVALFVEEHSLLDLVADAVTR